MKVAVTRWAAWSPGREDDAAWARWAEAPEPLSGDGVPDARFLPAMLRRRCTPLSKTLLRAAFDCCDEQERSRVRTVFGSRHGSINESVDLLENVARGERLSPAKFSHTVHNAQAGLFSIASGNREASSSLSACEDSFGCGWIECLGHLEREPERPVLFVTGDVPLSPTFAPLCDEPPSVYAVALILERAEERAAGIAVRAEARDAPPEPPAWPPAAEFLRFLLCSDERVRIPGGRHDWVFARG